MAKYKIRSYNMKTWDASGNEVTITIDDILDQESTPNMSIPKDINNRHYVKFLQDVKEQGIGIVEGPEVPTGPHYADLRKSNYPHLRDQLDKIYHEGLDAWRSEIKMVKDQYPKTMVGFTTTGIVPGWVQTEVDKLP